MSKLRFEINPGLVMPLSDRFEGAGYKPPVSMEEALKIAGGLKDADGFGFWGPGQITKENALSMAECAKSYGKEPATIVLNFWHKDWGWGGLTNKRPEMRQRLVREACDMVDAAKLMGIDTIVLWNAHDGVDYAFQADYCKAWDWLVEGVHEIASYDPAMQIGIEYKVREPRIHQFIANLGDAFTLINDVGLPNVGITLDLGHSIIGGERIAYSAARCLQKGKLFNLHFGDNYRLWDDDVVVGSVNTLEFIEVIYWLKRFKWDGWCALDQYPFKNNAVDAMTESIRWVRGFERLIERIGLPLFGEMIERDEPKLMLKTLREALFDMKDE